VSRSLDTDKLDIGGYTDVARREHNEDAFLIDRSLGLVVLADGVGGHQAGEVASALTCEVLQREITASSTLEAAIQRANREVVEAVTSGRGKAGMASTVVTVLLTEKGYEVAWVGDSRAYLWDGKLNLLTRDHSFVESQLARGLISIKEARIHPRRNVILQAVGMQDEGALEVGLNSGQLGPGSCLLLCSDGITDPLDNEQLAQLLSQSKTAEETCRRIVSTAVQCGGKDNATAVLIAHESAAETTAGDCKPARVVWTYDPETGQYEGLPDVTARYEDLVVTVKQTRVKPG